MLYGEALQKLEQGAIIQVKVGKTQGCNCYAIITPVNGKFAVRRTCTQGKDQWFSDPVQAINSVTRTPFVATYNELRE